MSKIKASELILNEDGSIYHLGLHPEDVAPVIITVGDQNRVERVSRHFDEIEVRKGKREFITHTGRIGRKRLTVISTGIGTDNIDIVINELDALVNIDLKSGTESRENRSLDFVRIGTSGGIRPDMSAGCTVLSVYSIGLDGLMSAYRREGHDLLSDTFKRFTRENGACYTNPYGSSGDDIITDETWIEGITLTCPGFYGPQFRRLRAPLALGDQIPHWLDFKYNGVYITNIEMETSGLFGLANLLGHRATSISAILANRTTGTFVKNPYEVVDHLIVKVLEKLTYE